MPAPQQANFALQLNYDGTTTSASRIFKGIQETLDAFEEMDKRFVPCIDEKIESILMLENVEQGSIKLWLRQVLKSTDDQALKNLDWKTLVGEFLVQTKYLLIAWLGEKTTTLSARGLNAISNRIQQEAQNSELRHLPVYQKPSQKDLVEIIRRMQETSKMLGPSEKFTYFTPGKEPKSWGALSIAPENLEALLIQKTIVQPAAGMQLLVRKPDYLSDAQWEFKKGKHPIRASIFDKKWLKAFHNKEISLRPGDSLECMVEVITAYDDTDAVLRETYNITKVHRVRPAPMQTNIPSS